MKSHLTRVELQLSVLIDGKIFKDLRRALWLSPRSNLGLRDSFSHTSEWWRDTASVLIMSYLWPIKTLRFGQWFESSTRNILYLLSSTNQAVLAVVQFFLNSSWLNHINQGAEREIETADHKHRWALLIDSQRFSVEAGSDGERCMLWARPDL